MLTVAYDGLVIRWRVRRRPVVSCIAVAIAVIRHAVQVVRVGCRCGLRSSERSRGATTARCCCARPGGGSCREAQVLRMLG